MFSETGKVGSMVFPNLLTRVVETSPWQQQMVVGASRVRENHLALRQCARTRVKHLRVEAGT